MPQSTSAYIALGSNLDSAAGDRFSHLQFAVDTLNSRPGIRVCAISSVFETEAHVLPGSPPQAPYLNGVIHVDTVLDPHMLLETLLDVERLRGRDRSADERWSARTLDLDLILFGNEAIETDVLTIPHPRLHLRRFVLDPLAEVANDLTIPAPYDQSVLYLQKTCPDDARIARFPRSLVLPSPA